MSIIKLQLCPYCGSYDVSKSYNFEIRLWACNNCLMYYDEARTVYPFITSYLDREGIEYEKVQQYNRTS